MVRGARSLFTRTGATAALAVLLASPVGAQEPTLAQQLAVNVPCAWGDPVGQMKLNADKSGADREALMVALTQLGVDDTVCIAIQDAAQSVSTMLIADAVTLDVAQEQAAQERMRQLLREADEKAASMRFEVGPPPRHMTRHGAGTP